MKTAIIKTSFWDDERFEKMHIDTKIVFFYLLANPVKTLHPITKINKKICSAHTGLHIDHVGKAIDQLVELNKISVSGNYYILVDDYVEPKKGRFTQQAIERETQDIPQDDYEKLSNFILNKDKSPRNIPISVKRSVMDKCGGRCLACGSKHNLQIDHIKAWINGGTNEEENLQILCASCNSKKGINEVNYKENAQVRLPVHKDKDKDKDKSSSQKLFEKFWELYPKKVKKKPARDKFIKLTEVVQKKILKDLPERIAKDSRWSSGKKYIPDPTTYLNQERWEDEIEEIKNTNNTPPVEWVTYK